MTIRDKLSSVEVGTLKVLNYAVQHGVSEDSVEEFIDSFVGSSVATVLAHLIEMTDKEEVWETLNYLLGEED